VNVAQLLALAVVAVASVVVFLLMRYPQLRRPQFLGELSFPVSVALACALVAVIQQIVPSSVQRGPASLQPRAADAG